MPFGLIALEYFYIIWAIPSQDFDYHRNMLSDYQQLDQYQQNLPVIINN
jgi:hypothetical protein